MAHRTLEALYCDDIRHEIGGKLSYIGVYNAEMYVPGFPITLPKLCVALWAVIPNDRPVQGMSFKVLKDDEVVHQVEIGDLPPPPADFWERENQDAGETFTTMMTYVAFSPLNLEGPCKIRVRAYTSDGEELKGSALTIREAPEGALQDT